MGDLPESLNRARAAAYAAARSTQSAAGRYVEQTPYQRAPTRPRQMRPVEERMRDPNAGVRAQANAQVARGGALSASADRAQAYTPSRNQFAEAGEMALEMTGLPSVRRSASAFTRGDMREGVNEGAMGLVGLAGLATLGPRSPRPALPRRAPAPVRMTPPPAAGRANAGNGGLGPRATQRFEAGGQRYRVEIDPDAAADAAVINFRSIEQGAGGDGINSYAPTGEAGVGAGRVLSEVQSALARDIAMHGRRRYAFVGDSARQSALYQRMARTTPAPEGYTWSGPDSAGMVFLERASPPLTPPARDAGNVPPRLTFAHEDANMVESGPFAAFQERVRPPPDADGSPPGAKSNRSRKPPSGGFSMDRR